MTPAIWLGLPVVALGILSNIVTLDTDKAFIFGSQVTLFAVQSYCLIGDLRKWRASR